MARARVAGVGVVALAEDGLARRRSDAGARRPRPARSAAAELLERGDASEQRVRSPRRATGMRRGIPHVQAPHGGARGSSRSDRVERVLAAAAARPAAARARPSGGEQRQRQPHGEDDQRRRRRRPRARAARRRAASPGVHSSPAGAGATLLSATSVTATVEKLGPVVDAPDGRAGGLDLVRHDPAAGPGSPRSSVTVVGVRELTQQARALQPRVAAAGCARTRRSAVMSCERWRAARARARARESRCDARLSSRVDGTRSCERRRRPSC